jgi:hypothetical protein
MSCCLVLGQQIPSSPTSWCHEAHSEQKMSFELVSYGGVNVYMCVAIHLPLVSCRSIELLRCKKDFLVIRAMGNHELLFKSHKPIFGFHWLLGL